MKLIKKPVFILSLAFVSFIGLGSVADMNFNDIEKNPGDADDQNPVLQVGDKAPDLVFAGPDGKTRKLSDLKGKIVLIDFWASWCRPCRMENPNVVKTYNEFKDVAFKGADGFEVFSVSLDRNKTDWEKAIQSDGLVWKNHVSDLKFWQSEAAKIYNVNSIPATFLIDGEGYIIAKNLRGGSLASSLQKLKK